MIMIEIPGSVKADSWKHRLFPNPVGMQTKNVFLWLCRIDNRPLIWPEILKAKDLSINLSYGVRPGESSLSPVFDISDDVAV